MDTSVELTQQFCRTCLAQVADFVILNDPKSVQIKLELSDCIPEMALDLVQDPVLCLPCVSALSSAYRFRRQCLYTEECIQNRIKTKNLSRSQSLTKILENCTRSDLRPNVIESKSREIPKAPSESTTRDVVDELNSLLDDALGVAYKPTQFENENSISGQKFGQDIVVEVKEEEETEEDFSWLNENFENLDKDLELQPKSNNLNEITNVQSLQHGSANVQQCFVKLERLSPNRSGKGNANLSKEKSLACNICKFRTAKQQYLTRHLNRHKKFPNWRPDKKFSNRRPNKKVLTCSVCTYKTSQSSKLLQHMESHYHEKTFACGMCEFKSLSEAALNKHLKTHGKQPIYPCSLCKHTTYKLSYFLSHMKLHKTKNCFTCSECGYLALQQYVLIRHMVVHSKEKPFVCSNCKFRTARKDSLVKHIRLHNAA